MPKAGKNQKKKKNKKALIAETPSAKKSVPSWALAPLYSSDRLSWSFQSPDQGGPWAWSAISPDDLKAVIQRLGQIETLDKQSIKDQRSIVSFARLEKPAQQRLRDIRREDIPQLIGWHVGMARAWFAEHDGIMFALWWDPDHTVYKVAKK